MVRWFSFVIFLLIAAGTLAYLSCQDHYKALLQESAVKMSLESETGFDIDWDEIRYQFSAEPALIAQRVLIKQREQILMEAPEGIWFFSLWEYLFYRKVSVNRMHTRNATIHYHDLSGEKPLHLSALILDFDMKRFNVKSPWTFIGRGYLNGAEQAERQVFKVEGIYEFQPSTLLMKFGNIAGTLSGNAKINNLDREKPITLAHIRVSAMPLVRDEIVGQMTADIEISGEGIGYSDFGKSLTAKAVFDLRSGRLHAGSWLADALSSNLTASQLNSVMGRIIKDKKFSFDMLQGKVYISENRLIIERFSLKHTDYYLECEGSFGLDERDLELRIKLVFMEPMSQILISSNPELESYRNESGRIVISSIYRTFISFEIRR